jgi:putative FmdB family regulatory protein
MPIYEYTCEGGHVFEVLQRIGEIESAQCKYCDGKAHRILSPTNFVLKGPGFYVNDYKKKTEPGKTSTDHEGEKLAKDKGGSKETSKTP